MEIDAPSPRCPACSKPMQFVRSVPNFGALPAMRAYECRACGAGVLAELKSEAMELAGL